MEQIKIKKLRESAIIPHKSTTGAAAFDLSIGEDVTLNRGRNVVKLGFAMQLPHLYCAEIEPRSGYSLKGFEGVPIVKLKDIDSSRFNADVIHGLIDEDYRGEVGVIIYNSTEPFVIKAKQRIAQMIIRKLPEVEFKEVNELDSTERGEGGFNSTGA